MKFGEFEEEEICSFFFFRVLDLKKKENSEKYGIKRELIFTYSLFHGKNVERMDVEIYKGWMISGMKFGKFR